MTAEEATKLSTEKNPVWDKEVFQKQLQEVYDAIEVRASQGLEMVYGSNVYGIKEGYIPLSGILPVAIQNKLSQDGFYVKSVYTGTFNAETVVAWGSAKHKLETNA